MPSPVPTFVNSNEQSHAASFLIRALRRARAALASVLHRKHVDAKKSPLPAIGGHERAELMADIRIAIRLGLLDQAEMMIGRIGPNALRDADCLNLRGVIEEARRNWKSAQRWYGKAMRADRSNEAAQQNMRRIYELNTFGSSKQPVALGDERPALFQLMKEREAS